MSDIFVSYAREDRDRVEVLVRSLQEQGFSIWWDRDIAPGESFDELIDKQISQAAAVLVVWTKHSIDSRWVRNEALEGMDRGILVPALLDDVRIPVAFRQTQLANLVRWPRHIDESEFHGLVDAIRTKVGADTDDEYVAPVQASRRTGFVIAGIAAALVVAMALWWFAPPEQAPVGDRNSVAVSSFEAPPGDDQRLLAEGIALELLRLFRIGGVPVVHHEAMSTLPDELPADAVLDRVGARFLVDGRVQADGDLHRLTATIFDAAEGAEVWSTSMNWSAEEMFSLNRQLAREIIAALGARTDLLDQAAADMPSVDREAYMLYLQGVRRLRQLGGIDAVKAARELLEQSIEIDSMFAEAHAALCRTHLQLYRTARDAEDFESAERYCHRALTLEDLDGTIHLALGNLYEQSGQNRKAANAYDQALLLDAELADAYIGLGNVLASSDDADGAEQAILQAVARQPGYWLAFNELGSFYLGEGRLDEAIEAYTRVTFLKPDNPWAFNNRGGARFFSGDFEGAIADWERANTLEPGPAVLSNIGTAYFHLRRFEDAAEMYRQALELVPNDHRLWGNLGDTLRLRPEQNDAANAAYQRQITLANADLKIKRDDAATLSRTAVSLAFMGESSAAKNTIERAVELEPKHIDVLYDAAVTYVTLGEPALAVDALRRAVEHGYSQTFVASDPLFDDLRNTPEYASFTSR